MKSDLSQCETLTQSLTYSATMNDTTPLISPLSLTSQNRSLEFGYESLKENLYISVTGTL